MADPHVGAFAVAAGASTLLLRTAALAALARPARCSWPPCGALPAPPWPSRR